MSVRTITGYWLGTRPYAEVLELQEQLHAARRDKRIGDSVLFLEHTPVVTFGRGGKEAHLLASPSVLEERGVELVRTGRGGDVTLHAPGQLVCYPIVDLAPDRQDVRAYVNLLTQVMQAIIAPSGIAAGTIPGYVGLWVDADAPHSWRGREFVRQPKKIGAIGVRISRWVTLHGFALNLSIDLRAFSLIVPCGIHEYGVTSVKELSASAPETRVAAELGLRQLALALRSTTGPLRDLEGVQLNQYFERVASTVS